MKLIAKLFNMGLLTMLVSAAFALNPLAVFGTGVIGSVTMAIFNANTGSGLLYAAGDISVEDVADELKQMFKVEPGMPRQWFLDTDIFIRQFCKRVVGVKGKFHVPMAILTNVVQGFSDSWTAMGETDIKAKPLDVFHLKVNLPVKPMEIHGTWLGWATEEDRPLKDRTISRYIAEELLRARIIDDVNYLSTDGEFDDATKNSVFGAAMDGLATILTDAITETLAQTTAYPVYLIQTSALSANNIVDEATGFVEGIPRKMRRKCKYLFMSSYWADKYKLKYEETYGTHTDYNESKRMRTRIGNLQIVGIDSDALGDLMFATPDGNIVELIDKNEVPRVHDVQIQDYTVKIFAEAHLGYDFAINQAVFTNTTTSIPANGLQNPTQDQLYYGVADSGSGSGS